jgi:hypothetical protein
MSSISAIGGANFIVGRGTSTARAESTSPDASKSDSAAPAAGGSAGASAQGQQLSEEEQKLVEQLKRRDQAVRLHEQAHLAAAGQYARGGASFVYQTGPDGKRYAIGGEVQIDSSAVSGDPRATIEKARQIRQAALAPSDPSGQDQAVAAAAAQLLLQAEQQLREQSASGSTTASGDAGDSSASSNGSTKSPASPGDSPSASSTSGSGAEQFAALVAQVFANRSGDQLNLIV